MNSLFTALINFLSNKTNLPPVLITIFLLFIMWLITVANIDGVALVSFVYLIFLPIIVVWNSVIFGKSWWERPKKNYLSEHTNFMN